MEQEGLPLPARVVFCRNRIQYSPVAIEEARDILRLAYAKRGRKRANARDERLETDLRELRLLTEAQLDEPEFA